MKEITGRYFVDSNFVTVYCDNTIYTIARATKEWASCKVGDKTAMGAVLTQEAYDKWAAECTKEKTFQLI